MVSKTQSEARAVRSWNSPVRLTTVVSLALSGCVFPEPKAADVQVPVLVPAQGAEPHVSQDNVTVTVLPVHWGNYTQFPQVNKRITWREAPPGRPGAPEGEWIDRTGSIVLLPLPSFQVQIENRTGHVLRTAGAVIRLRDQASNSYTPLARADVSATQANVASGQPWADQLPQIQIALSGLTFVDSTAEILPNETLRGYLVFSIPPITTPSDYERFMASIERLTVVIADLVTETDPAGNPSRRTQFEFHFDRTAQNVRMMCPAEAEPSIELCAPVQGGGG